MISAREAIVVLAAVLLLAVALVIAWAAIHRRRREYWRLQADSAAKRLRDPADRTRWEYVSQFLDLFDARAAAVLAFNSLLALAVGLSLRLPGATFRPATGQLTDTLLLFGLGCWLTSMVACFLVVRRVVSEIDGEDWSRDSTLIRAVAFRSFACSVAIWSTSLALSTALPLLASTVGSMLFLGNTGEIQVREPSGGDCVEYFDSSRVSTPVVTTDSRRTPLRSSRDDTAQVVASLNKNFDLYVQRRCGNWLEVVATWSGLGAHQTGWILRERVCTPRFYSIGVDLGLVAGPKAAPECKVAR